MSGIKKHANGDSLHALFYEKVKCLQDECVKRVVFSECSY